MALLKSRRLSNPFPGDGGPRGDSNVGERPTPSTRMSVAVARCVALIVLAGIAGCSGVSGKSAPGGDRMSSSTMDLEPLFSLELQYRGPIDLAPIGEKVGSLVGGGDGTLVGPRIKGTVRWSNYETTSHDAVCSLQIPGLIQTNDGAQIQFEGRELAMPLPGGGKKWRVAGVMRFKTEDKRYRWLNEVFAVTSGNFDYEAGKATWNAYVAR